MKLKFKKNCGKKPFPPDKFEKEEVKEIKQSTTDHESGYYVKDESMKQFAYPFHAAADRYGFILGSIVTPGNVHDSNMTILKAFCRQSEVTNNLQLFVTLFYIINSVEDSVRYKGDSIESCKI